MQLFTEDIVQRIGDSAFGVVAVCVRLCLFGTF